MPKTIKDALFIVLIFCILLLLTEHQSVFAQTPIANPGTTNLVAWWSLNETAGTRNDCFGANALTDNNTVAFGGGKQGNAASFASASLEYLSRADNANLSMGNINFTLGGWVNMSTLTSLGTLLAKGASSGANKDFEYVLEYDSSSNQFYFSAGNGTTYGAVTNTTPAINAWYFLVAWHDSVADKLFLQVNDGTPVSVSYTGSSFDGANPLTISKLSQYNGGYINGRMDEVFIYKRVLTAAERSWLFNNGNGRACSELTTAPTATPSGSTNPGANGLSAWWGLNEVNGVRMDAYANNHLTDHGVASAGGKQGNAATFTPNQYLDINDNPSLSMGNLDFTVGGWVNLAQLGTYRTFIAKGPATGANKDYEYFLEYDNVSGRLYFGVGNGVTYGQVTDLVPALSTWYFVVAWHNSVTDTLFLQVNNGVPVSASYSSGSYDSPYPLAVGRLGASNGGYLNGMLDEVFLYKRVLTHAERTWLYNGGAGRAFADVVPPTPTPTATRTNTPSPTFTFTPTKTVTPTVTFTQTSTPTYTPTYTGTGACWHSGPSWPQFIVYYDIDSSIPPAWIPSINAAAQTWNNTTPSVFTFIYQIGSTNTISYQVPQGSLNLAGTAAGPSTGPHTYTFAYTVINPNYMWDTNNVPISGNPDNNGSTTTYNVQNVMTHEFGHWLFLHDIRPSLDPGCTHVTMDWDIAPGEINKITLDVADENGINWLYP